MKLAFCLFNYFPYGGLQRDFMRIAQACYDRGHEIHVYTMRWDGEPEAKFHIHLLEVKGWQNHVRCRSFANKLKTQLETERFDLVVGFNKMPNLDLYYAADVCYASRVREQRSVLYRLLPRYKQWKQFEKDVFTQGVKTKVMLISARQEAEYIRHYQTEPNRFQLLPPGIDRDRIAPPNAAKVREMIRSSYHVPDDHFLLLMVGSGFKTKGLDRSIQGLASLPAAIQKRCHLFVIGKDDPMIFKKLARRLNVENHIQFLGGRSDVPHFLLAADLLLHPSYHENTGTVLLEAIAAGLPVLTVGACGYAHYVQDACAGIVLPELFQQREWNKILEKMLLSPEREQWHQNALAFANKKDIYSLPEKAADFIERVGCGREHVPA